MWWLVRITLAVAFGFLPQNFGRWKGPTNCHFAGKDWSLSGADNVRWWGHSNTTRWLKVKKIELYALTGGGETKSFCFYPTPEC